MGREELTAELERVRLLHSEASATMRELWERFDQAKMDATNRHEARAAARIGRAYIMAIVRLNRRHRQLWELERALGQRLTR